MICVWKLCASASLNSCCNNLSNSDVVPLRRQWMNYVTIAVLCWTITILVCCKVGLKSFMISVDYRDYMGSSLETWLLVRSFLHLNSYNLVGSMISPFYLPLGLYWIRRWPLRQSTSGSRPCRLESESVVRCVWWDGWMDVWMRWIKTGWIIIINIDELA